MHRHLLMGDLPNFVADMSPEGYLSYLQTRYLQQTGLTAKDGQLVFPDSLIEEVIRDYPDLVKDSCPPGKDPIEHLRKLASETLTLYPDPFFLKPILDTIKAISPSQSADLSSIPIGYAPVGLFNAGTCPVPSGGSVILINMGANQLLSKVNSIMLGKVLPVSNGSNSETEELIPILRGLIKILRLYSGDTNLGLQYDYLVTPATILREIQLTSIQFVFILLHELAHVELGHADALRRRPREDMLESAELEALYESDRRAEFAADLWAAEALASGHNPGPVELGATRIKSSLCFLFETIHCIEWLYPPNDPLLISHPPAWERLERILKAINRNDPTDTDMIVRNTKHLFRLVPKFCKALEST